MKTYRMFAVVVALVMVVLAFGPSVASAAPAPSPAASDCTSSGCWYHVKWGDTLGNIAAKYGVTTHTLASMNDYWCVNHIWPGQVLKVPCYAPHPTHYHFYSNKYGCWGYSYYNNYYGKTIFICTD
jgi:hypothetical protein